MKNYSSVVNWAESHVNQEGPYCELLLLPHLFPQPLLSCFTLHPCPVPDCEYPNDINRVVITLTGVTAEALLRGTVLTTLRLPEALTPTPINTYEYWQRPSISIITFQVCVSALSSHSDCVPRVFCLCGFLLLWKPSKLILLAHSSIS